MWHTFQMMFVTGVIGFLLVEGTAVIGLCIKVGKLEDELKRRRK